MKDSLAIGIEIGGTKLQAGVGLHNGKLLSRIRRDIDPSWGGNGIRAQIPSLIEEAISMASCSINDLVGIGVGFGGPIDTTQGCVLLSHQIKGWTNFPLRDWLALHLKLPVTLQNDAKTAGYAEAMLGAGRGLKRIFYITVGSGIGGGFILDGRIDEGQGLGAGEIGHTWVLDPQTGRPKELEHVASGWSIEKRAKACMTEVKREVTAIDVYTAAAEGDSLALAVIEESAEALAVGMANVIALLHPERIIIGGGVSLMGPLFWKPLRAKLWQYAFKPFSLSFEVVPAALGEEVVVIGAVLLALEAGNRRESFFS